MQSFALIYEQSSGAELGGVFALPPSGILPPADTKGPPLYYCEISIFGEEP